MAKYVIEDTTLIGIADAIREKEGSIAAVPVLGMRQRILDIQTGIDTSDATTTEPEVVAGETFYADGEKKTGTMPKITGITTELAAGESMDIDLGYHDGTGKVKAKDLASQTVGDGVAADIRTGKKVWVNGEEVTGIMPDHNLDNTTVEWRLSSVPPGGGDASMVVDVEEGYYEAGAYPVGTLAMYQPDSSITPGTEDITLPGGAWYMNGVTIAGDENLVAENIRSGVTLFGIPGSMTDYDFESWTFTLDDDSTVTKSVAVASLEGE